MTAQEFAYWLQGFFELSGPSQAMTVEQVTIVRNHLALVFAHDIDPKYGGPETRAALNEIHAPSTGRDVREKIDAFPQFSTRHIKPRTWRTNQMLNEIEEAMIVMDQCLNTPGKLLDMCDHSNALQAFASFMRDKRYPEARVKILSIGHRECDLELIEKAASGLMAQAGHPIEREN